MLIVVRVVCLGAVEVDCSGVVDLFVLGGVFFGDGSGSAAGGGVCCEASAVVFECEGGFFVTF